MMGALSLAGLLLQTAAATAAAMPTLTLDQAVQRALHNQPQIQQAHATTQAAQARVSEAFAPLLPQVTGTATYQRSASQRGGGSFVSSTAGASGTTGTTVVPTSSGSASDFFSFGLTGSLLVYDFGQTTGRWRASQASASGQEANEVATRQQVMLTVRTAYFQVRAQKAMLDVARETLANQDRHLSQIEGFVQLGSRPEIDLAQARADRASAEVQVINAQNGVDTARAQLAQSMGEDPLIAFDVSDDTLSAIPGEDGTADRLVEAAVANRPDLRALRQQQEALRRTVSATKAGYAPSVGVSAGVTESGGALDSLGWGWNARATLTWPIYQGGLTRAQVSEAEANVAAVEAQVRGLLQQIRFDLEQARLAARAAKAALASADVAVVNARERYRLAEARYATGVGSIIELGDAQVALSTTLGQRVQADYALATARAQLLRALGQP